MQYVTTWPCWTIQCLNFRSDTKSKLAMTERVMGVKYELGAVVVKLVSGNEISGGPYVNLWSGNGVALKKQSISCEF
jgi:hypothetical protein